MLDTIGIWRMCRIQTAFEFVPVPNGWLSERKAYSPAQRHTSDVGKS
ncbi:MAG TPA: hypothetical protein PK299_14020 [Anaerolineales bacterium]|nr:hypothetical protein [Anaerolineales bacterium]